VFFTKQKFQSLNRIRQHEFAAKHLRVFWETMCQTTWSEYLQMCTWLSLPEPSTENHHLANRLHYHLKQTKVSVKETHLLPSKQDKPSSTAFLPIAIYLEDLRSAFNVGSILRTAEAFRLGTICFSQKTPNLENNKVRETSMGAYAHVPCKQTTDLEKLPRPFIGLETVTHAPTVFDFSFPNRFTLILGNEETGIGQETMRQIDHCIQIPLVGWKHSLNVASAFAIAAAQIHQQLRCLT